MLCNIIWIGRHAKLFYLKIEPHAGEELKHKQTPAFNADLRHPSRPAPEALIRLRISYCM